MWFGAAVRLVVALSLFGVIAGGAAPGAATQGETGAINFGATVVIPDEEGYPHLADVCVRVQGDGYDEVGCTKRENQANLVFHDVPLGIYELSVDSVPPGCVTADLPAAVTVDGNGGEQVIATFLCDLATLTIHKAECPADTTGDIFAACHGNTLAGMVFQATGPIATGLVTDDAGVASERIVGGTIDVLEVASSRSGYTGAYVYCSDQESGAVLFDDMADRGRFTVDVRPNTEVICDVYNLTEPATVAFPITAYLCETDPGQIAPAQGLDLPEDCAPAAGVIVTVETRDGAAIGDCTTGSDGRCSVDAPSGFWIVVTEDEDTVPIGYAPRENPITTRAYTEFAEAVFVNLPSNDVAPIATVTPGGTVMPNPPAGRPAHIHPGTCGKLRREPTIDLVDVRAATGETEGSRRATPAEVSYTVIDVSLDDLLATSHAVNVHQSSEAMGAYLACGEIGGVRGDDGSLAVGLREVNGSGFEGIAYLAPNREDPDRTDVWVFIAPKLAEEEHVTPTAEASPGAG